MPDRAQLYCLETVNLGKKYLESRPGFRNSGVFKRKLRVVVSWVEQVVYDQNVYRCWIVGRKVNVNDMILKRF